MKGIMFNEHIGLESAVLDGTKTMTRRICPDEIERGGFTFRIEDNFCLAFLIAPYKIGVIVADFIMSTVQNFLMQHTICSVGALRTDI